jgi:hypothetical protein
MNRALSTAAVIAIGLAGCSSEHFVAPKPTFALESETFSRVALAIDGQPVDASTELPSGKTVQLQYKVRFSTPRDPDEILRIKSMLSLELALLSGLSGERIAQVAMRLEQSSSTSDCLFSAPVAVPKGEGTVLLEASILEVEETTTAEGGVAFRPMGRSPFHQTELTIR